MTFVNCFSKSINPISRLPIPRRVPPRALLAAELCDNWQLIAQVSPSRRSLASRDIPRTATGAIFVVIVIVKIDACFLSVPHFCAGARVSRFVSFCFGTVRCSSVLSSVASRAALCSIGAMIDGENVTVTGYMRLPTWPEEPQLVWVLDCAKWCLSVLCAARCMLHSVWCGGLRSGCRAVRMLTFNCVANWAIFALCRLLTNDKPQWEIVVHI